MWFGGMPGLPLPDISSDPIPKCAQAKRRKPEHPYPSK